MYHELLERCATLAGGGRWPDAMAEELAGAHPQPGEIEDWLAALWDSSGWGIRPDGGGGADDPAWRQVVITLCRAGDEEERRRLLRAWAVERTRALLDVCAHDLLPLRRAVEQLTERPFPDAAELEALARHLAAQRELDLPVLRRLVDLVPDRMTSGSALRWCELCEELQGVWPALDRREWLIIGLDLLRASLAWEAPAVTAAATRMRRFAELAVLEHPGYAPVAEKILQGQRDILNGTLVRAALRFFPRRDLKALAELNAAGLALGLNETDLQKLAGS
jgi:hypothetical protein